MAALLLPVLYGCALYSNWDKISVLNDLGAQERVVAGDRAAADHRFARLVDDVKRHRLSTTMTRATILRRYGEPIAVFSENGPSTVDKFLYRRSDEFLAPRKFIFILTRPVD